jgi:hypothetical protein
MPHLEWLVSIKTASLLGGAGVNLQYWYMLPVSILIATTVMASGVEVGLLFILVAVLTLGDVIVRLGR